MFVVILNRPPADELTTGLPSPGQVASASAAASPSGSARPSLSPSPSATASTRPAVPAGCSAKPSSCGLPDSTNTGVPKGTKLTVINGDYYVQKAGTVVDRKDIRGCVYVQAPNVTIKRSKVTCDWAFAIRSLDKEYSGGGLTIEDVEISCANSTATGVAHYGFTARRVNVHGCENGFSISNDATVERSYIHDLVHGQDGHTDGIQLSEGGNIVIRNNTIFNQDRAGTSAIISNETGLSNVLVQGNLLAGGSYALYCPRDQSSNFRVIGNRVSQVYWPQGGRYGAWTYCGRAAESRDNIWDSSLGPLP